LSPEHLRGHRRDTSGKVQYGGFPVLIVSEKLRSISGLVILMKIFGRNGNAEKGIGSGRGRKKSRPLPNSRRNENMGASLRPGTQKSSFLEGRRKH